MTFKQTKEQFLLAYNSNAYLNMCESDDMHNVIVALDKQIPKKVKREPLRAACPICNYNLWGLNCPDRDYCPRCGQSLDWSDT